MTNYRNPKYIERYEDVVFELDTALITPGNNAYQKKDNHSGELRPGSKIVAIITTICK